MLTTIRTLLAIRTSSVANRFIYYAQKLPLIGGRFPDSLYAHLAGKKVISVFAFVLTVLWGLVSKLAYTGLLVYLPAVALSGMQAQQDQLQLFLHIFLLLSFGVAGITTATILEPRREKYIAVKHMRMKPAAYMRTSLGYRYCTYLIFYIPSLVLFMTLLGASVYQALALAVSLTLWKVCCEYGHLILFEKTGMVLIKNNLIVWLAIGLGFTAAYAPLVLDGVPLTGAVLLLLPTWIVIAALGIAAAIRLGRHTDYRSALDAATNRDDPLLDLGRMVRDAQKTSVQTKESDHALTPIQADKLRSLEGYAFLNAMFFARHRSLIVQPVYTRLAIIGGLGVVGTALALLNNEYVTWLTSNVDKVLLYLVLIMNFLSVGEKACRAMFYNCDLSLLHYSFYRKAAPRHFLIRLYRIAGLNLGIAAALGAALTLIIGVAGEAIFQELLLMWVCLLALSFLFSIHPVLMYYLFQPYSTELNVKNPFFFLMNFLVTAACWISIGVSPPPLMFAIILVILTLVYFFAAQDLVRRFGPRTFRLK